MRFFLSLIMLLLLIQPGSGFSQADMSSKEKESAATFYYDIINVASQKSGLTRLNLYIEVPYDELQFLKQDDKYLAEYEVSVVIYDENENQIDGKIWQEEVSVDEYKLTNSLKFFSLSHTSFHLKPETINISIGLTDVETKNTGYQKTEISLSDFTKNKISISDITFTDDIEIDSLGLKSIHPQISSFIRAAGTQLYCYFELYSQLEEEHNFEINYSLKDMKDVKLEEQKYFRKKDGPRTMEYFSIDKNTLTHGIFTLEVEIKYGKYKDSIKEDFTIRWVGAPTSVADLNLAIEQLKYIAKKEEYDELINAADDEKINKFKEFWHDHDPTVGTEKNELMNEYYRRIEYTNKNFSGFREGWMSDMGMIYIIFGTPGDIERHPFDRDSKPWEVWYYYTLNRQFIFVDATGFGDFRLSNPIQWQGWQRGINY